MAEPARVIELSHVIHDGMTTFPGLPGPEITDHLGREASRTHYAAGTEFHIGRISMVGNTGTYLDTPFHRYAGGADLAGVPAHRLVDLDGLVVRLPAGVRAADRALLSAHRVAGRAVLVHTGWDAHFGTDRYAAADHPYLSPDAAAWLAEQGAALVGIDSVSVDYVGPPEPVKRAQRARLSAAESAQPGNGGARPAHSTLLAAGIPIVEHLRGLDALPETGFRFSAPPPMIAGLGSFPVRAYAIVDVPAGQ